MRRRWVQVPPGPREEVVSAVAAGLLGAGVGLVTFYLVRLLLAREPIEGPGPDDSGRPRLPASGEDV